MKAIEQASSRELEMQQLRNAISRTACEMVRVQEVLRLMAVKQLARVRELARQETLLEIEQKFAKTTRK